MPQQKLIPYDEGQVSPNAIVGENVSLGLESKIWYFCVVYGNSERPVRIGRNTQIGSFSQIKPGVKIGDGCRIQDGASIPDLVEIGNYVFVAPRVTFTNDRYPSALKVHNHSYKELPTYVKDNAVIGARSVINSGITIGKCAVIGMGSVVTKDVPDYAVVIGNPARVVGDVRDEKFKDKYPEFFKL